MLNCNIKRYCRYSYYEQFCLLAYKISNFISHVYPIWQLGYHQKRSHCPARMSLFCLVLHETPIHISDARMLVRRRNWGIIYINTTTNRTGQQMLYEHRYHHHCYQFCNPNTLYMLNQTVASNWFTPNFLAINIGHNNCIHSSIATNSSCPPVLLYTIDQPQLVQVSSCPNKLKESCILTLLLLYVLYMNPIITMKVAQQFVITFACTERN